MDDERFEAEFGPLLAGLRERRGACPSPECLTALAASELVGAERAAAEEHCRLCSSCAAELARATAAPAEVDDVAWRQVERALDRRPAPWSRFSPRALRPRSARSGYWLGLAAALALVASLPLWRGESRSGERAGEVSTTRGAGLQALAPAGAVRAVGRFEWASPPVEATYRVEVRRGDETVWIGTSTASPLVAPPELFARLAPRTVYRWRVEGVGPEGRPVLASAWTGFELRP